MSQWYNVLLFLCLSICGGRLDNDWTGQHVSQYVPVWLPRLPAIPQYQNLTFKANDATFTLGLNPVWSVITIDTNITIFGSNGSEQIDGSRFSKWYFGGMVNGNTNSFIHGTLENGIFDGYFQMDNVTYFIEPCWKNVFKSNKLYNAILYTTADIHDCPKNATGTCGGRFGRHHNCTAKERRLRLDDAELRIRENRRQTRQTTEALICSTKIVGDFRFSANVKNGYKIQTLDFITSIMNRVDNIFRNVDFDLDGRPENIGFYVTKIEMYLDPVRKDLTENDTWNPVTFFEELRQYDFNGTCAGLLFTYRQLDPETEQWGGPSLFKSNAVNESQGICSTFTPDVPTGPEDDYGKYFSNALPVNFRQNNRTADEATIVVHTLHQLAHLFGSLDDQKFNDSSCNTLGHSELFISSFPPPSGHYPNNLLFSPCSINVMKSTLQSSERPCLKKCHDSTACNKAFELPVPRMVSFRAKRPTRTYTERCVTIPRESNCERPTSFLSSAYEVTLVITYVLGLQMVP